ncbi:tyrosinase family oxidase copper chaperone [Streptomyces sp. CAU 1734]|uniref:apotyrosinase chaperone MelC1 n=1 Tax=Streptomyces sp. CAU 1734 TaxID=3140360 RepID=UPI0032610A24
MSKLNRRQVVGTIAGAAAGLAVAGVATASANATPEKTGGTNGRAGGAAAATRPPRTHTDGPAPFDEVFEGRRIQGFPAAGKAGAHAHHGAGFHVLIDGRELHVMRLRNNTWTSVINHYQTFPDPHTAARAAVTSLKGAALVPYTPTA